MATPIETRNELLAKKIIKNLERRNMEGYYCKTKEEAVKKALEIIPEGSSVSWGGSATIRDIGLTEALKAGNYEAHDRDVLPLEKQLELYRKVFSMDCFVTSANAISKDGVIINIDGRGNRVAAISFGPKEVVMVIGLNKVAKDADAALKRARGTAAPFNVNRFPNTQTPCKFDGTCHNCTAQGCICCSISILRYTPVKGRIKVILVDDTLGF